MVLRVHQLSLILQKCPVQVHFRLLEDVAVLGECCPSGRDSSVNLLILVSVSGAGFLSQYVLGVSVVDTVCRLSSSPLYVFDPDFYFRLLYAAVVVVHVVYWHV